jgi:hypothetical protein
MSEKVYCPNSQTPTLLNSRINCIVEEKQQPLRHHATIPLVFSARFSQQFCRLFIIYLPFFRNKSIDIAERFHWFCSTNPLISFNDFNGMVVRNCRNEDARLTIWRGDFDKIGLAFLHMRAVWMKDEG